MPGRPEGCPRCSLRMTTSSATGPTPRSCYALARWNKRQRQAMSFYTQASIDMVRDEELLGLMRDANFVSVFIGIESPRKSSLAETRKTQNEKLDMVEAIHKIQSYNLFISAGMIVGFDNDDASIFDDQYEFLQQAGIPIPMVSAPWPCRRRPCTSG